MSRRDVHAGTAAPGLGQEIEQKAVEVLILLCQFDGAGRLGPRTAVEVRPFGGGCQISDRRKSLWATATLSMFEVACTATRAFDELGLLA
jgi:hypothetical protein